MGTEVGQRMHDDVHSKVRLISISDSRFARQRERQSGTGYSNEHIPRRILARQTLCTNLKKRNSKRELILSKSLRDIKLDRYSSYALGSPWKLRAGTQLEQSYEKSKSAPLKKKTSAVEPISNTDEPRPNTIANSRDFVADTPSFHREKTTLTDSTLPPGFHRETTIADSVALPTLRPDTKMVTLRQLSEILQQSDKTDREQIKVHINHLPNGYPNIMVNLDSDVRIERKPRWFEDSKTNNKPGNFDDEVSSINSSILQEQLNKERHEKFLVKTELNTASCFVHPLNAKYLKELDRQKMVTQARVENWLEKNPVGELATNSEIAEDGWLEITAEEQKYHNESKWVYPKEAPDYFEKFRKELRIERHETASERSAKNRAAERKKLLYYMRLKRKQRMDKTKDSDNKSDKSKPTRNKNAKIVNKTDIK